MKPKQKTHKVKKKFKWQLMWAFVLIGYGIYSTYTALSLEGLSKMASNVSLGQASVFFLWGLRELFGGLK